MTSEIAVMNQRAVALAADSAVTLIDGGTVIVRNDTRKLFNLAEGLPVAVMFYGVADMMGHPWEHLIEHFQKKKKPGKLRNLRDYATNFIGMLDGLEEFFPAERQGDDYKRLLASVYRFVFQLAQYLRETGERANATDRAVLEEAIAHIWRDYQTREDGSPRPDLACFPQGFAEKVQRDYAATIEELINYGFSSFELGKTAITQLRELAAAGPVTLLYSAHDEQHNQAVVLLDFLATPAPARSHAHPHP